MGKTFLITLIPYSETGSGGDNDECKEFKLENIEVSEEASFYYLESSDCGCVITITELTKSTVIFDVDIQTSIVVISDSIDGVYFEVLEVVEAYFKSQQGLISDEEYKNIVSKEIEDMIK